MATWYAQYSTNWTNADPTSGGDPSVTSIWNSAADGSGSWGTPTSSDTADVNGFNVNWDSTGDGGTFANAASIVDGAGGGTFQPTTAAIALGCNLNLQVPDQGSANPGFNSIGGFTFLINNTFTGPITLDTGTVTNNSTIDSVTQSGGTFTNVGVISSSASVSGGTFTNDVNALLAGAVSVSGGTFNNNATAHPIGAGITLSGGTFNNAASCYLSYGVTFNGTNATLNNSGVIDTTAVTMSGSGDVLNNSGTISVAVTINLGECMVTSTPIATITVNSGGLLFITGGNWTGTTVVNFGLTQYTTNTTNLSGVSLPVWAIPPASQAANGTTYGIASFGPAGTSGQLTGTYVSPATTDVKSGVTYGPSSSLTGSYGGGGGGGGLIGPSALISA